VTHEHELADLADRRISLRDGRIVSDISARFADGATVRDAEVEATL
jgi:ABC-type lipoprotein export system ATPase subunit